MTNSILETCISDLSDHYGLLASFTLHNTSAILMTLTFMLLADAFIQCDLHCIMHSRYSIHFITPCIPLESNP